MAKKKQPKEPTDTEQLLDMLRVEYDACKAVSEIVIKPSFLAEQVRKKLDPDGKVPTLLSWAAVLELRKLASDLTRPGGLSEDDLKPEQYKLFELQRYYHADREGEDVRVLREHLTVAERRHCANTLRAEAASKIAHADALDAETDALIKVGKLPPDDDEPMVA